MRPTSYSYRILLTVVIPILTILSVGCNPTKHLKEDQYLLKSNSIDLDANVGIAEESELTDALSGLIIQRPNTRILGQMPYKVWLYNLRYEKYEQDANNFQIQSKTAEKPVVYDSASAQKATGLMKTYMFQQGYFYAKVSSTTKLKKNQKAFVTYHIDAGINYLIKNVIFDIDDSTIKAVVSESYDNTILETGKAFNYNMAERERSRIVELLRNKGYYQFSNDNISFVIDTIRKDFLKDVDNPFESAINFIASQKEKKKPTLDIKLVIREGDDPLSYKRFGIKQVYILPDFRDTSDFRDNTMKESTYNDIIFRYHDYYVREKVLAYHTFLIKDKYYSQSDYEKTVSELNQLGIFESVRVVLRHDTSDRSGYWLRCFVVLSPSDRYDLNTNWEVSSGTNYALGTGLTVSVRNRNLAKGANFFTISATGGLEYYFDDTVGNNFFEHFGILSRTAGINASLDMPKFLFPISSKRYSIRNSPRTIVNLGVNLFDRVQYFRLFNISSSFTYKWKETETKTWEVTPAFANVIRRPWTSDDFSERLRNSEFLANSYRQTFIEGENVSWTFSDRVKKNNGSYSYVHLGLEEAGGVMAGLNTVMSQLDSQYAQYLKFDFDLQQFFKQRHSTVALRFYGGVGMPYGQSKSLPYIKQYFVGGAYSMRGWRVRTLGPGSYTDSSSNQGFIDLTGDIKLELNGEYRFEMIEMFAGVMKLNGAAFFDAGNIWLANPSDDYPGGVLTFKNFANDIAISGGFGLRLDIAGFFLLRLDAAVPIKDPRFDNGGWRFNEFSSWNNAWDYINRNKQINFAIGYPF